MSEPKPHVIIATEHESVVRFYAGHAGNGGINQTGQFTTTRPIDPTDLVNMAVDLASTFGWLHVHEATPVKQRAVPKVPHKALPPAQPHGLERYLEPSTANDTANTPTPCPLDPTHVVSRQNMHRHLTAKTIHGVTYSEATRLMRTLPKPATAPRTPRKATKGKWQQIVACPEPDCTHTAKRSNMTTHLQGGRHAYGRQRANEVAAALPAIGEEPQPQPKPKPQPIADAVIASAAKPQFNKSRGVAGTQRLTSKVYPAIVEFLRTHGPATTPEIAQALNEPRQATRKHMQRAKERGLVRDVSEPDLPRNTAKTWATVD